MKKLKNLLNIVDGEILMEMVKEVNNWADGLSHLEYMETERFDEYFYNESPTNIANMIYYGSYDPKTAYFKISEYGNIVSYSIFELWEDLENHKYEIVKEFIDLYQRGHVGSTYQEVLDILNSEEE